MKILFAAGGTGGHINPALAIAGTIKARHNDAEILFAGTPWGMEARFVPEAGFNFVPIKVRGIERGLSLRAIKGNFKIIRFIILKGPKSSLLKIFHKLPVFGQNKGSPQHL